MKSSVIFLVCLLVVSLSSLLLSVYVISEFAEIMSFVEVVFYSIAFTVGFFGAFFSTYELLKTFKIIN